MKSDKEAQLAQAVPGYANARESQISKIGSQMRMYERDQPESPKAHKRKKHLEPNVLLLDDDHQSNNN